MFPTRIGKKSIVIIATSQTLETLKIGEDQFVYFIIFLFNIQIVKEHDRITSMPKL